MIEKISKLEGWKESIEKFIPVYKKKRGQIDPRLILIIIIIILIYLYLKTK